MSSKVAKIVVNSFSRTFFSMSSVIYDSIHIMLMYTLFHMLLDCGILLTTPQLLQAKEDFTVANLDTIQKFSYI